MSPRDSHLADLAPASRTCEQHMRLHTNERTIRTNDPTHLPSPPLQSVTRGGTTKRGLITMTTAQNDRPTYTDPNALSLDGASEAEGIAFDHDMPWTWPHRWRPARRADA